MKVSNIILFVTIFLILSMTLTGCNLPSSQSMTPNAYTAAAMTVTALAGTEQVGPPTSTPTLFATFPPPTITAGTNTSAPPAPQASSTPSGPVFVTDVGANCRSGPGTNFDRVGSFAQGSYIPLVGRNADRTWWVVRTGNSNCWISATTGHTSGPVDNIPEVQSPPTPTATSTSAPTAYP